MSILWLSMSITSRLAASADSQSGGVKSGEEGAMFEVSFSLQECSNFRLTEHGRQPLLVSRIGDVFDHPLLTESNVIEEAESTDMLVEHRPGNPPLFDEEELILADMFGAKLIRGFIEMLSEVSDTADVSFDG